MKTTKRIVDEQFEEEYNRERAYLNAERETRETELMREVFEGEMKEKDAKIVLGKPRKVSKFAHYATVIIKRGSDFLKKFI